MRISDCSSDVCSSDLPTLPERAAILDVELGIAGIDRDLVAALVGCYAGFGRLVENVLAPLAELLTRGLWHADGLEGSVRSEEHTSELQSLMRISYAVFCLKQKTKHNS